MGSVKWFFKRNTFGCWQTIVLDGWQTILDVSMEILTLRSGNSKFNSKELRIKYFTK